MNMDHRTTRGIKPTQTLLISNEMKLKKLVTRMTPLLDEIVQRIKDTNDLKFLAPVEENCQNSVVVCLPLIPGSKI